MTPSLKSRPMVCVSPTTTSGREAGPWLGIATQPPVVLGHEFCGVVEEVGSNVTQFKKGDRVVIPFNHSCGRCEQCQAGHQNVCLDLRLPMLHYTGGFGRY